VFDEVFAQRTAERLEEMAYVYWQRELADDASALLAAATAFRERSPDYHTVGRAMLEVVLAPALKAAAEAPEPVEGDDDSLLVKP
jgi:hypothetical protein